MPDFSPESGASADASHNVSIDRVYDELREIARLQMSRQNAAHTLQPTALVNEACLKLLGQGKWKSESHFLAVASVAMRQVLVDHARRRASAKRGAGGRRFSMTMAEHHASYEPEDILELDDLLGELAKLDSQASQIAQLKLFGGMTNEQISEALSISRTSVVGKWSVARAWLLSQHQREGSSGDA